MKKFQNKSINFEQKGIVNEIERYAINDGPGIRTVIFFKGCPMQCLWCSNPETQQLSPQLMYWKNRCISCKNCISVCPNNALTWNESLGVVINRKLCQLCGECENNCYSNALTIAGKSMSVIDVMNVIRKDILFYKKSGGGVTFSGGETMMQVNFLFELAKACKTENIHTCIETAGYVPQSSFKKILPFIDLFLYDIKIINDVIHKKYTGVSNKLIHSNFEFLIDNAANIIVRIPIIPDVNDSIDNVNETIDFLKDKRAVNCAVSLLPYHSLGVSKYDKLDMEYSLKTTRPPSHEKMTFIASQFINHGFKVTIGE